MRDFISFIKTTFLFQKLFRRQFACAKRYQKLIPFCKSLLAVAMANLSLQKKRSFVQKRPGNKILKK